MRVKRFILFGMGNRFTRSVAIAKESYRVLKTTPSLAFFPVVSGIACLVATISFLVPLMATGILKNQNPHLAPIHYVVMFLFYFATSFIVIFFNSALVSCAYDALNGRPTTYQIGLRNASQHLGAILIWSLISASIGLVLRMVSERVQLIGKIIIGILGGAWSLVTYFVIPVMVIESGAPVPAVKRSFGLVKATWGERVIGGLGIGMVFGLLMLLGFIPFTLAIIAAVNSMWVLAVPSAAVAVLYWVALAIVSSTLSGIFNTAMYIFASSGQVPSGFSEEYIRMAFIQKQQSKIFGNRF